MSKEDQPLGENEQDSTLDTEKRDSGDSGLDESAFEELFSSFSDENAEKNVSREELDRVVKGVKHLASELGRIKKNSKQEKVDSTQKSSDNSAKETQTQTTNPVLKSLFFNANPEAEEVWDLVEKDAKALNKDPFELYSSVSGYKMEAQSRAEAKKTSEESKKRINAPSSVIGNDGTISFSKIDLGNEKHLDWLNEDPSRMEKYNQWLKKNWTR